MSDDLGPQNCPHGCGARYAAAVLEHREDWSCPECGEAVAPCPVCQTIVSITDVYDEGDCPACRTDRLDLGQTWREKEQAVSE